MKTKSYNTLVVTAIAFTLGIVLAGMCIGNVLAIQSGLGAACGVSLLRVFI